MYRARLEWKQWSGTRDQLIAAAELAKSALEERTQQKFHTHLEVDLRDRSRLSDDLNDLMKVAERDLRRVRAIRIDITQADGLEGFDLATLGEPTTFSDQETGPWQTFMRVEATAPALEIEIEGPDERWIEGLRREIESALGGQSLRGQLFSRVRLLFLGAFLILLATQLEDPVESWLAFATTPDTRTLAEWLVLGALVIPAALFGATVVWMFPDLEVLKTVGKTRRIRWITTTAALVGAVATSAIGSILVDRLFAQ